MEIANTVQAAERITAEEEAWFACEIADIDGDEDEINNEGFVW